MGTLYVVPTPVGNMEDITFRAIRILKEADVVLAEDTRTSGVLLKHYDIKNQLLSHHKFNEHGTSAGIVGRLLAGQNVALISDAGTPGISDPGFFLVREAVKAGVEVQCLPRLLCQRLFPVGCLATASASRASFHRRKDARQSCSRYRTRSARWCSTSRPTAC